MTVLCFILIRYESSILGMCDAQTGVPKDPLGPPGVLNVGNDDFLGILYMFARRLNIKWKRAQCCQRAKHT